MEREGPRVIKVKWSRALVRAPTTHPDAKPGSVFSQSRTLWTDAPTILFVDPETDLQDDGYKDSGEVQLFSPTLGELNSTASRHADGVFWDPANV